MLWTEEWAKEGEKVDWRKLMAPRGLRVLMYFVLAQAFSNGVTAYDLGTIGAYDSYKQKWTDERQELLSLHTFAPTALGLLYRVAFMGGRFALEHTKALAKRALARVA